MRKKEVSVIYAFYRVGIMMIKASPFWTIVSQSVAIIAGLVMGYQIIVTRTFFDVVTREAGLNTGIQAMLLPTLAFGGIVFVTQLLLGIDKYLENPVITYMERNIKLDIYKKSARTEPIEFEKTEFLDDLYWATCSNYWVLVCVYNFARLFTFYLPYFAVTAGFYMSLRPELIVGILIIFIPSVASQILRSKYFTTLEEQSAPLRRKFEYMEKAVGDRVYFKETRLLGAFGLLHGIYKETMGLLSSREWKTTKKTTLIETGLRLITLVGYISILWLMISYLVDGRISVGSFAAVFSSIGMLIATMEEVIVGRIGMISGAIGTIRNFVRFMDLPERGGKDMQSDGSGIELRDVTFCYPGRDEDAIKGLSLSIKPGETVAVVGANGAGKTTLMRLISGLYLPKDGNVSVGGMDTKVASPESIYEQFSAVFQNFMKYQVSLEDNVIVSNADNTDSLEALDKAGIDILSGSFPDGLDTMLSREFGGVDISGGQWQRVAISRGYHRNNSIILLDEPTAAIDPMEESRIYSRFADITRDKTAIIVTHRMGSAKIADRIIVMKDGIIDDEGSHDELILRGGHYAQMWDAQAKWYN